MPTIQVEAKISRDDLLKAAEQLPDEDLKRLLTELLALQGRRHAPCLTSAESELLLRINAGLSPAIRQRYQELIGKRQNETLTTEEHAELLQLTDQVEQQEANRAEALAELARLRQVSLSDLMQHLGLAAVNHE